MILKAKYTASRAQGRRDKAKVLPVAPQAPLDFTTRNSLEDWCRKRWNPKEYKNLDEEGAYNRRSNNTLM